ncbi:hypothetical protein ACNKHK_02670 [Shigella flexneri]
MLIWPVGIGKSTLPAHPRRLDDGTSGESVGRAGTAHYGMKKPGASRGAGHVGFVFQLFRSIAMNALENVDIPALLRGENRRKVVTGQTLPDWVGKTSGSTSGQLSAGAATRSAGTGVYLWLPDVLFADEPMVIWDRQTGDKIADLLFSQPGDLAPL